MRDESHKTSIPPSPHSNLLHRIFLYSWIDMASLHNGCDPSNLLVKAMNNVRVGGELLFIIKTTNLGTSGFGSERFSPFPLLTQAVLRKKKYCKFCEWPWVKANLLYEKLKQARLELAEKQKKLQERENKKEERRKKQEKKNQWIKQREKKKKEELTGRRKIKETLGVKEQVSETVRFKQLAEKMATEFGDHKNEENLCSICLQEYLPTDGNNHPWVLCDSCNFRMHINCLPLRVDILSIYSNEEFFSHVCPC